MKKICLIIPYFGKWPSWMPYYFKSCEFNPTITWLLFTDCGKPKNCPKNVKIINFSINDFNKLASKKLKLKINIKNPYKICDIRPAFGIVFNNYLKNYDFWGYSDIDIIYGNIRKFTTDKMLSKYDIISAKKEFLAGNFTIYKNTKKINNLFKKCPNYKRIFKDPEHYAFDECNQVGQIKKPTEKEKLKKYNMTWVVKNYSKRGHINSYFKKMQKEIINPTKEFKLYFDRGKLTDNCNNEELLYLHLLELKKINILIPKKTPNKFYITNHEIFINKEISKIKKFSKILLNTVKFHFSKIDALVGKAGISLKNYSPKAYNLLKTIKEKHLK